MREATEGRGAKDRANQGGLQILSVTCGWSCSRSKSVENLCGGTFFASIIKSETANRSFMFASSSSSSSLLTARHFTSRQFSFFPSHLSALQKKVYYCIRWGVSPHPHKKGGVKTWPRREKRDHSEDIFLFFFGLGAPQVEILFEASMRVEEGVVERTKTKTKAGGGGRRRDALVHRVASFTFKGGNCSGELGRGGGLVRGAQR